MTFKTPCFVRVEDAAKRQKLIEWLKGIGYNHFPFFFPSPFIATDSRGMIWMTDANRGGAYDAGTSIELFKALAAMNDENDLEQWFVVKKPISDFYDIDDVVYQKGDMFFNDSGQHKLPRDTFRKATVEEIVKHIEKQDK